MKHLMLFEAFESNALSKMMKFLKSKVDNNSKEKFRDNIKRLINQFDIPIDKISDKDVKYLNRNQATKLRNTDTVENGKGIYCLKFWFSMDEGYLGFTGTGNTTMDFKSYIKYNNRNRSYGQNIPFTEEELNYIKNSLNIKTGKLTPVKDYNNLEHKQLVIGIFSSDEDDMSRIGLGKMWRSEYDELHCIQSVAGGGEPDRVNGESWRELRENDEPENEDGYVPFSRSWSMGSVNSPGSDHHKLHIYTPSEEPLHIEGEKKEEEKEEEKESPYDFNLPLNSSYNLREWGETSWSINTSIGDQTLIEKSDFSIILMLDDILKSVKTKVSNVKKSREESREGATKLLSDSQIRKANIERYLTTLVAKMGIERDIKELKNLQKLVIKSVCNDFAFISIYKGRPGFDTLDNLSSNLYEMMKSKDDGDRDYYLSNIISNFKTLNSYSDDYITQYTTSLNIINNSNKESIKEIFKIFMEIGKKIKNYLLSQNIQSIEDLGMVLAKLKSIRGLAINERGFSLSYTRNILNEFHYSSDVEYYISRMDSGRDNEVLEDIKKSKHIERYVESLLR